MPRNLDTALAAELAKGSVRPFYLCDLTLARGMERVWSGVGPLVWNGNTYSGLGELAGVGAVHESSGVQADGTTISLNIAPSQLDIPPLSVTPPAPPRATVAGESVAWSLAGWYGPSFIELVTSGGVVYGSGVSTRTTAGIGFSSGNPLGANTITMQYSHFALPLEIPAGAIITGVYAVVNDSGGGGGGNASVAVAGLNFPSGHNFGPAGLDYSPDVGSLADATISVSLQDTTPGTVASLAASFVGMAVYYRGSPLTKTSLMYEAINDVRVGAPVNLWFGMMSAAGAIIGAPFLVFSGLVDEPSIVQDPAGTKIVLALENRLRNHARAGGRRYTAADQKLDYPNDSGFNWVEILEEISLKWGS